MLLRGVVASVASRVLPSASAARSVSSVAQLSNGVRVVSDERVRSHPAVAVVVGGGASQEAVLSSGASHLLARSAFQGTSRVSFLRQVRDIEDIGAAVSCAAGRDAVVYAGQCYGTHAERMLRIVADAVGAPRINARDVEALSDALAEDAAAAAHGSSVDSVVQGLHSAAFRDAGYGLPTVVPAYNVGKLGADAVQALRERFFRGGNVVLAVSGMSLDAAVKVAQSSALAELPAGGASFAAGTHRFVGGEWRQLHSGATTTVGIAMPGAAFDSSDEAVTLAVLQTLLSGTSGVVGRHALAGALSRLGRAVADNEFVSCASSFSANYRDAGLFGLVLSGKSAHADRLADLLSQQVKKLTDVEDAEVARARVQLRNAVLAQWESAERAAADIGRQVLFTGAVTAPAQVAASIEGVSTDRVVSAAKNLVRGASAFAVSGNAPARV